MTNLDYTTLRLRGALDITRITGFTLHVGVNDHAHAVVEGEAGGDAFEQIRRSLAGREMSLLALDEDGEERPIFTGVVAKAALMGLGQYPQFRVELLSGTSLLDHEKRCRSFQDVGMTYEQLALQIMSEHTGGAAICTVGEAEKLGRPVIQYRETDWEFLMRMASRCGGVVVPETRYGMPRIWFGFPERSYPCSFPEDKYSVGYSPRFWELGGEMMGYSRADFLYYDVESGQNCDLGWHTTFKGHDLLIMEKWAKLERGELRFTYRLGRPGLGWGRTIYNERIRGMSLLGEVLATERETLKLRLDIDEGRDPGGPYAYDWRPETGNMMYCMPQVGTRVSLYFPDHDEQHAMAVNCVRTNGSSCDRMSDPSKRAFVTEHGKELTLYPDSMALSGAGGKISLVDDRGLDIISEHGIMIAGRSVEFNAPRVSIIAEQSELMLAKGDPLQGIVETSFLVSHQYDLRSNSRTVVVGLKTQEYEPYTDKPQEDHFDWLGLAFAVVGMVAAFAVVSALTLTGVGAFVVGGLVAGAVCGGLNGLRNGIETGYGFGGVLKEGLFGATVGAVMGAASGLVSWAVFSGAAAVFAGGEIAKLGLGGYLACGGVSGGINSALGQLVLNEDHKIDPGKVAKDAGISAGLSGAFYAAQAIRMFKVTDVNGVRYRGIGNQFTGNGFISASNGSKMAVVGKVGQFRLGILYDPTSPVFGGYTEPIPQLSSGALALPGSVTPPMLSAPAGGPLVPISGSAGLIPISGGNVPVPVVPIFPVSGGGTQVPALVEGLGQSALPKPAPVSEMPKNVVTDADRIKQLNLMNSREIIKNDLVDFRKEVLNNDATGEISKICVAMDASNLSVQGRTGSGIWCYNPTIVDYTGRNPLDFCKTPEEFTEYYKSLLTDEYLESLPDDFWIGKNKQSVKENMAKLRAAIERTKMEAAMEGKFSMYNEPSFESLWNVENCAEIWSAREAILNGARFDDLIIRTENLAGGEYAEPCKNCQRTFEGTYIIGD